MSHLTALSSGPVASSAPLAVEVVGLSKVFGATVACRDVSFDIRPGEVLALIGENGAGKSTCVKMLGGVYRPDAGQIRVAGSAVELGNPLEARAQGIAVVHQHPELFPELSIAENIFAGQPLMRGLLIDHAAMVARSRSLLGTLGLDVDPAQALATLRISEQQLVEVARALASDARVLILDEPTAALTSREVDRLFDIVASLSDSGVGVLFVGHRLEEILRISDRVTVMRDGEVVATRDTAGTDTDQLVELMVGRTITNLYARTPNDPGDVVLETSSLTIDGLFTDVSLTVRAGEVVGLAGLVGSGRTEVARTIFGVTRPDSGRMSLDGVAVAPRSPADALRHGIAYVSEDRRGQSIVEEFSILDNAVLPVIDRATTTRLVSRSKSVQLIEDALQQMRLKFAFIDQPIASLSGGNQQKVVLAKWLATRPRLLILDEPTQGIDIAAKAEVHRILDELSSSGIAILLISSDMPELLGSCDRTYVMNHGSVVAELAREEMSQLAIGRAATDPRFASASAKGDPGDTSGGSAGPSRIGQFLRSAAGRPEFALAAALLALVIPVSLANPNFYRGSNLQSLADYSALIGLLALGEMVVILTRNIDLSVASILGLSAYATAATLRAGQPVVLAVVVGLVVGAACGLFNGALVAYGGVPSIVVTLGTLAVFRGLLSEVSSGDRVKPTDVSAGWLAWSHDNIGPFSSPVVIALVLLVGASLAFRYTRGGRQFYFSGSNPDGAKLLGMRPEWRVLLAFVGSGLLSGIAGVIWASYYPYVDGQVAIGVEQVVIAAVVVGGVALRGGSGTVLGVAIGTVGLLALRKVLVIAGVPDQYLQAVYGTTIVLAVTADVMLSRRRLARAGRIR